MKAQRTLQAGVTATLAAITVVAWVAGCGGSASPAGPTATVAAAPTPTPCPTERQSSEFAFVLKEGAMNSFVVGPIRAGNGPLDVTLNFSGRHIVLACVGTSAACRPMGGRPMAATFDIPGDFPAGPIQASVYFNSSYAQPPGDVEGTVRFAYNPYCSR